MSSTVPQIGFDRFIHLDWVAAALEVRAGRSSVDELSAMLEAAGLSLAARKKTRTVLNRLWLEPRPELVALAARGLEIHESASDVSVAALSWGMAIASYPFFGKVAELVGRLSALQGDCAAAEVHRRMSETYGEREGTYRMTNMVLQSQVDWSLLSKSENGKTLTRKPSMALQSPETVQWLSAALLMHVGRPLGLDGLAGQPTMFPFSLGDNLGYVLSSSDALEVRADSAGTRIVGLKDR